MILRFRVLPFDPLRFLCSLLLNACSSRFCGMIFLPNLFAISVLSVKFFLALPLEISNFNISILKSLCVTCILLRLTTPENFRDLCHSRINFLPTSGSKPR
jgi:hypothetical protein